jgi:hypothetical protein
MGSTVKAAGDPERRRDERRLRARREDLGDRDIEATGSVAFGCSSMFIRCRGWKIIHARSCIIPVPGRL